jgi:hypothetical protein
MAVIKTVQEESLVALGDAIREKAGTNEPLVFPTGMIEAIEGIETGGGSIEIEPIVLTGTQAYGCAGEMAGAYITLFGNTVSTSDITGASNMFKGNTATAIPFDINCKKGTTIELSNMFNECKNMVALPAVLNAKPSGMSAMFLSMQMLAAIPDDYMDTWDMSYMQSYSYSSYTSMFNGCSSLRQIPSKILSILEQPMIESNKAYYYLPYSTMFYGCYVLDELTNLPVGSVIGLSSNMFQSTFASCGRVKNIMFAVNEDGTPKTAKWKSQLIDLSTNVGFLSSYLQATNKNSGITKDKEVKDDATYQALKNDPDWFTINPAYSRYNHDSAVETINSLPDTSAYGTNTIKFRGKAGSATDGGAINTLTEEEIAVAAAKGWTVSFA